MAKDKWGNRIIRGFKNLTMPLVKRTFGGLIAHDLIKVQPMTLPAGKLFFLDYTYGNGEHTMPVMYLGEKAVRYRNAYSEHEENFSSMRVKRG